MSFEKNKMNIIEHKERPSTSSSIRSPSSPVSRDKSPIERPFTPSSPEQSTRRTPASLSPRQVGLQFRGSTPNSETRRLKSLLAGTSDWPSESKRAGTAPSLSEGDETRTNSFTSNDFKNETKGVTSKTPHSSKFSLDFKSSNHKQNAKSLFSKDKTIHTPMSLISPIISPTLESTLNSRIHKSILRSSPTKALDIDQGLEINDYKETKIGKPTFTTTKIATKTIKFDDTIQYYDEKDKSFVDIVKKFDNESSIFDKMKIDDLVEYFTIASLNDESEHAKFIHVTSRHNIERLKKRDFYDMVLLERPGAPKSGYVWNRMNSKQKNALDHDKIMQLSIDGLLINTESEAGASELISLPQLMYDRGVFYKIRAKKFFGYFAEGKYFTAWRRMVRRVGINRAKTKVFEKSFYSSSPLVTVYLNIINVTNQIETDVELFAFSGSGSIKMMDFLALQNDRFEIVKNIIKKKVDFLSNVFLEQYEIMIGQHYVEQKMQDVKDHHPYQHAEDAGLEVNWLEVRTITRIKDDAIAKLENLLWMAQFALEISMARMLNVFWRRMKQFISGIDIVKEEMYKGVIGYWPLDVSLRITDQNDDFKNWEEDQGMIISEISEKNGQHVSIDLAITAGEDITNMTEYLRAQDPKGLKISVFPSKNNLVHATHTLIGSLGSLLDSIPNLRNHSLVREHKLVVKEIDISEVLVNGMNEKSGLYFVKLHFSPVLSSDGAREGAFDFLHRTVAAHSQASSVYKSISSLEGILEKLRSIHPEIISKQLDRSLILPKIRELIEITDSGDDGKRAVMRDTAKLRTLEDCILGLQDIQIKLKKYPNLIHELGIITSFKEITVQLNDYVSVQTLQLLLRLPPSFSTRCRQFIEYIKTFEKTLDIENKNLADQIELLRKLQNYELASSSFQAEGEICESMYRHILECEEFILHWKNNQGKTLTTVKGLIKDSTTLYTMYRETQGKLNGVVGKAKTFLLGRVMQIKTEVLLQRRKLHERITTVMDSLMEAGVTSAESIPAEAINILRKCGVEVDSLKNEVNSMINTQNVLLKGHDVIGAANMIFGPTELDNFADMQKLEKLYMDRNKAWGSIVECNTIKRKIVANTLGTVDINDCYLRFRAIISDRKYLEERTDAVGSIELLKGSISELQLKVDLATCLSTSYLRPRHWNWLSDNVLVFCGLLLKFAGQQSDIITVTDVSGQDVMALGGVLKLGFNDLIYRGIESNIEKIKYITAEAVIEGFLETIIHLIEEMIQKFSFEVSNDWLQDYRLRERISFELSRVINFNHLNTLIEYCSKACLIVQYTAIDMSISVFDKKFVKLQEGLLQIQKFLDNYRECQFMWYYVLYYVKFPITGELDRDTVRLYQSLTEDCKRIESIIQQRSRNVLLTDNNILNEDISVTNLRTGLLSIMEAEHASIQSLLDACPRLSLLSYRRIRQLNRAFKLGPVQQIKFLNKCMHELFEGVGTLSYVYHNVRREFYCTGFISYDYIEKITFDEGVSFVQAMPNFINTFEAQLKNSIISQCDNFTIHRIKGLQSLLTESNADKVLDNIGSIFSQRITEVLVLASDSCPNQLYTLFNFTWFVEDVWLSLGHITGCLKTVRPDLEGESSKFSKAWRNMLIEFSLKCKANIKGLHDIAISGKYSTDIKMKTKKASALCSSLILQEISFLRVIEALLKLNSLESANEYWASRYQIRFIYSKENRVTESPFDVCVGCVTIPYGLEYYGACLKFVPDEHFDSVLLRVLSSSMSSRSTLLVRSSQNSSNLVTDKTVSVKDIAISIGRIHTALTAINNMSSVKFFLSRLLYLEAVGCVDFENVDHAGLHLLVSGLTNFWNSLKRKQDTVFVDALKYPMKTSFSRTELVIARRRENSSVLRHKIDKHVIERKYCGLMLVALASERNYVDVNVFNSFSRSVFDFIVCNEYISIRDFGAYLATAGFAYANEISKLYETTLLKLLQTYKWSDKMITVLGSFRVLRLLTMKCLKLLSLQEKPDVTVCGGFSRYAIELECFGEVLWEFIALNFNNEEIGSKQFQRDLFLFFQQSLDNLTPDGIQKFIFESIIGNSNGVLLSSHISNLIKETAQSLGLIADFKFVNQCARAWEVMSLPNTSVMILSGNSSCGKTSVRKTIIHALNKLLPNSEHVMTDSKRLKRWHAGQIIVRFLISSHNKKSSKARDLIIDRMKEKKNNTRRDVKKEIPTIKEVEVVLDNNVTVIYTSSLPSHFLMGSFDSNGHWNDGILTRTVRRFDTEDEIKEAVNTKQHFIVLDGSISFNIEQLFTSHYFQSNQLCVPERTTNASLSIPSGETHLLSENVKLIIETDDVTHASPAFLSSIPHQNIIVPSSLCVSRLLTVWVRSIDSWLRNFPPWLDLLQILKKLLLVSSFVEDVVAYDVKGEISNSLAISRVSCFLRYFEELLTQCHSFALSQSQFSKADRDEEDSDSDESIAATETSEYHTFDFARNIMTINSKAKEMLTLRFHLSLIYAATWGFGGLANSSNQRGYFDSLIRDVLYTNLPESSIVDYLPECVLFDAVLNLEAGTLLEGANRDTRTGQVILSNLVPMKFQESNISVELGTFLSGMHEGELLFRTPSIRALECAIKYLLCSEANLLLIGKSGSGKTRIINELLRDLKRNTIRPDKIKEDVQEKLMDIITSDDVPDGIATCLRTLKNVMLALGKGPSPHDDGRTFENSWSVVRDGLKDLWSGGARSHFISKSIFSTSTSIRTKSNATTFRTWLESQFRSEVKNVLETPRLTYGMIFIDDMHILNHNDTESNENTVEGFLKGFLDETPSFGIRRIKGMGLGSRGLKNGQMFREISNYPVVHIENNTDPKLQSHIATDNYIVQRMGTIGAATGDENLFMKTKSFEPLLRHFGIITLASESIDQVHDAIINASYYCLNMGSPSSNISEVLKQEILELSNFTMSVINKLSVIGTDVMAFTPNFYLVSRLCEPLILGSKGVANPGGLIQLYLHEWRRNFLDPIPTGILKEKIRGILKSELDNIDVRRWFISMEWLSNISNQLDSSLDRVWVSPSIIMSPDNRDDLDEGTKIEGDYKPLELDSVLMSELYKTEGYQLFLEEFRGKSSCNSVNLKPVNNGRFASCLNYPGAVLMILRLVRLLSMKKRYILLSGFIGSARLSALNLAASICKFSVSSFDVKDVEGPGIESPATNTASLSCDLKTYLKNVVLKVAGVAEVTRERDYNVEGYNNLSYYAVNPEKMLIVINGVQSLSKISRQIIVDLIDYNDPTSLFDDKEILAIAKLLRSIADKSVSEKTKVWNDESVEAIIAVNTRLAERSGPKKKVEENNEIEVSVSVNVEQQGDQLEDELDALLLDANLHDHSQQTHTEICSGYIFHWVKNFLSDLVLANLKIAFNHDIPLVMKLKPAKQVIIVDEDNDDNEKSNKTPPQHLHSIKRSFSLLGPKVQIELDKPRKEFKFDVPSTDNGESNIYSCPLLFSMLKYKFFHLWWSIDSAEAVSGICNFFLRKENKAKSSSLSLLALNFEKIGIYDDPEEERRQREREMLSKDDKTKAKLPAKIPEKVVASNIKESNFSRPTQVYAEMVNFDIINKFTSILDQVGIFKSFNCFSIQESFVDNSEIERQFSVYVDQAKIILPYILTLQSPFEAGILTDPIICFSVERNTEIAVNLVMNMLKEGSAVISKRLAILNAVKERIQESFIILTSIAELKKKVKKAVDELQLSVKDITHDVEDIDKELDNMDHLFRRRPEYENFLFMKEDRESMLECAKYRVTCIDEALAKHRKSIYNINTAEWNTLAAAYDSKIKPSKEYVDTMRAIMVLINFSPKVAKTNNVGKMDETAICRNGATLLRSPSFATQIATVNPVTLSTVQMNAIHTLNNILLAKQGLGEGNIGLTIPEIAYESLELDGNKLCLEILRKYLLMIESYYNNTHRNMVDQNASTLISSTLMDKEAQNKIDLDIYEEDLVAKKDIFNEHLIHLNHELLQNKSKIITLEKLNEFSGPFQVALNDLRDYIETESAQLDYINEVFVADCCVAAAILTFSGWFHEQIRQQCMEHYRSQLLAKGIKVSDTPFVLGNIFDRLQCRVWSCPSKKNLPRDPSSLNTLSLVALSPLYTYIVDPDGVAESAIANTVPEGYQTCTSSAQKFSLELLKSWLAVAREVDSLDPSLYIIITDLQSGVSDDLIAFLAAELAIEEKIKHVSNRSTFVSRNATEQQEKITEFNLSANFDPSITYSPGNNSISLCKIRLHLISSRGLTMTEKGTSEPLPISCLKNIVVIYWSTSIEKSYYVESKPFNSADRKNFVADEVLCHRMCNSLSKIIAPDCNKQFENISQDIFQVVSDIYDNQNDVVMKIYEWICIDYKKTIEPFVLDGVITQEPIPLGLPAVDFLNKLVVTSHGEKRSLLLELDMKMTIENELLTYQGILAETFSMTIDFLRTCGVVIPQNVLPPYGLSTRVICSKFIEPAIAKAVEDKLFLGIPESLYEMNKLSMNFTKIQKAIRRKLRTQTIQKLKNSKISRRKSVSMMDTNSNFLKLMMNSKKVSGLDLPSRKRSSTELQFLLIPFRSYILREAIDYIMSSIRPGLSWLVKLSCLIATWSKAAVVPDDEIRSLLIVINGSYGQQYDRYSFYTNFDLKALDNNKIVPPIRIEHCGGISNVDTKAERLKTLQRNHILRWMQYGLGRINGLKINQNSPRWSFVDDNTPDEFSSIIRTSTVISDHSNSDIVSKEFYTNNGRQGDDFEFDWLQNIGVKTFTMEGTVAANTMFGSINSKSFQKSDRSSVVKIKLQAKQGATTTNRRSTVVSGRKKRFSSVNNRTSRRSIRSTKVEVRNRFSYIATLEDANNKNNLSDMLSIKKSPEQNTSIRALKTLSTTEKSLTSSSRSRMFSLLSEVKGNEGSRRSIRNSNHSIISIRPNVSKIETKKSESTVNPFLGGVGGIKKNEKKEKEVNPLDLLLTSKEALKIFNILENHPSLSSIFGGMSAAIADNIEMFLTWKEKLKKISIIDLIEVGEYELEDIVLSIIPPTFECYDDLEDPNNGAWVNGSELTITQSMLFSEVILPGSSGRVADVMFALLTAYLGRGGLIVNFPDEIMIATDDDDYDENEDEEDKVILQNTPVFNCWTKMRKVLQFGPDHYLKRRKIPKSTVYRDYENWEGALYSLLLKEADLDRAMISKNLRLCLQGSKSSLFIAQYDTAHHIAVFTESARNISAHNEFPLTVISDITGIKPSNASDKNWDRNILNENNKIIKLVTNISGNQKLLFELIDISSPLGNATISSNFSIKNRSSSNEDDLEYYNTLGIKIQRRKDKDKDIVQNTTTKLSSSTPQASTIVATQAPQNSSRKAPINRNTKVTPLIAAVDWNRDSYHGPAMFICEFPFKW